MIIRISRKNEHMRTRDPYAIYQADEKAMQEKFTSTISGYQVCTYDENNQPEKGFNIRRDPVNSGNTHRQTEERKLKDQFPIHKIIL